MSSEKLRMVRGIRGGRGFSVLILSR
jgi:hypothetical protein